MEIDFQTSAYSFLARVYDNNFCENKCACCKGTSPLSEPVLVPVVGVSSLYGTHPPLAQTWVAPAEYWWLWRCQFVHFLHCSEPLSDDCLSAIATFELGPLDKRDLHWYLEHPPLANPGTEIVSLEEMSHPVMSMVWCTLWHFACMHTMSYRMSINGGELVRRGRDVGTKLGIMIMS